jgi:hypothetical protein
MGLKKGMNTGKGREVKLANDARSPENPATLVAILVAAHKVGDRDLEREMRSRLQLEHGVRLVFSRGGKWTGEMSRRCRGVVEA